MGASNMPAIAVLVFTAYTVAVLSPLLVAAYLVFFRGPHTPRRWLFLLVAPTLAYGFIVFAWVLIVLPVLLFIVYLLPALRAVSSVPLWNIPLFRVGEVEEYVAPVALLALSYWIVFYLWRRWSAIARALG
jgi:hypothetical protein